MDQNNKTFPNGFRSWIETFYEVTANLNFYISKSDYIAEIYKEGGRCAMHNLAESLTDDFERKNKGREWDGEFFEEIDEFCVTRLKI